MPKKEIKQSEDRPQNWVDITQIGKNDFEALHNEQNNFLRQLYNAIPDEKADDFRDKTIQLLGWTNRDFINKLSGFSMVTESEKLVINLIAENL
jgi:DNA-binding MarR family transcriptional regulator